MGVNGRSVASPATRWWSRLLFRQQEQPPQQQQLGRLAIPPEIILLVMAQLSKPSMLSLALTCRTLYNRHFSQCSDLSPSEKKDFLLLLEKDAADFYFCHRCVRLHRWSPSWFRRFNSDFIEDFSSDAPCRHKFWIADGLTFALPYPLARVVMNRHIYGPAHGVPAHKLDKCIQLTYGGAKITRTIRARIIENQLIMSSVVTLVSDQGDAMMLRRFVDQSGPLICPHLGTTKWNPRPRLPELSKNSSAPDYFEACNQSARSCLACMTDYCIDISFQSGGWFIKISTYQYLGTVRSPSDWDLGLMLTCRGGKMLRFMHPLGKEPGIVRHLWSKGDKVIIPPEGDWAV